MPSKPGEYWVALDVLDTDAQRLEDATGLDDRVGGVVRREPSDGSASVVFQIPAWDPDAAYLEALAAYEALRRDAALDPAAPLAGSVTRLRQLDETALPPAPPGPPEPIEPPRIQVEPPPHERWLEKARILLANADPDYATIAAQTACEVAIAETMRQLIAEQAPHLQVAHEKFIAGRFTLLHDPVRALWNNLTDDTEISRASFWEPYRLHVNRRNVIVHAGQSVTADQAAESVELAEQVCSYVIRAAPGTDCSQLG